MSMNGPEYQAIDHAYDAGKAAADGDWKAQLLANAAEAFIEQICTWMPAMSAGHPEVALRMRDLRAAIKTVREP